METERVSRKKMALRILSVILVILNISTLVLVFYFLPPVSTVAARVHLPLIFSTLCSLALFSISKKGRIFPSLFILPFTLIGLVSTGIFVQNLMAAERKSDTEWQRMRVERTVEWRNENCALTARNINHELYKGNIKVVDVYSCDDKTTRYYQDDSLVQTIN